MTQNEFLEEEFKFLEMLKNTSVYRRMKELSKEISLNVDLTELASERDSYLEQASNEENAEKKHDLLVLFNKKDNELRSHPLMKEYLALYSSIHSRLSHLSNLLTKEIKS